MIIADLFIYELGKYTIRRQPLPTNPAFSTHLIFYKGKLVGRQLSVPTVSDCEWYEKRHGVYADSSESHQHSAGHYIKPHLIRGRRSKTSKLCADDVRAIRVAYSGAWGEQTRFAKQYRVSVRTIYEVVHGLSWTHVRMYHRGKLISES